MRTDLSYLELAKELPAYLIKMDFLMSNFTCKRISVWCIMGVSGNWLLCTYISVQDTEDFSFLISSIQSAGVGVIIDCSCSLSGQVALSPLTVYFVRTWEPGKVSMQNGVHSVTIIKTGSS